MCTCVCVRVRVRSRVSLSLCVDKLAAAQRDTNAPAATSLPVLGIPCVCVRAHTCVPAHIQRERERDRDKHTHTQTHTCMHTYMHTHPSISAPSIPSRTASGCQQFNKMPESRESSHGCWRLSVIKRTQCNLPLPRITQSEKYVSLFVPLAEATKSEPSRFGLPWGGNAPVLSALSPLRGHATRGDLRT